MPQGRARDRVTRYGARYLAGNSRDRRQVLKELVVKHCTIMTAVEKQKNNEKDQCHDHRRHPQMPTCHEKILEAFHEESLTEPKLKIPHAGRSSLTVCSAPAIIGDNYGLVADGAFCCRACATNSATRRFPEADIWPYSPSGSMLYSCCRAAVPLSAMARSRSKSSMI